MAIQAAGNRSSTSHRIGTSMAFAMAGGLAAVVTAVGIATWRDAAHDSEQSPVLTVGAMRELPPTGGMAELYAEQAAPLTQTAVGPVDTTGGMAEFYRERTASGNTIHQLSNDTRGGLAELYAELEAARRDAAAKPASNESPDAVHGGMR